MYLLSDFSDIHREIWESVHGWAWANLAPEAAARDAESRFDESLYACLDSELGVMNITLPESLGGANLDAAVTVFVIEALSECDPGMAMSYLAQELLFSHQLYWTWQSFGREMPTWQADILKKKQLSGMAMTEPEAGTDVLGMKTVATPVSGGFVLNGVKQWITNGTVGKAFLVYARTGEGRRDISLFVVPGDAAGLERSACENKMGMRSSPTGILAFHDCFVPSDALVGNLNEGLRPMIRNLAVERIGLAAQSCGIARTCLSEMQKYASQRQAFGKTISEFGQIQHLLAGGFAKYLAMQSMLCETLHALVRGSENAGIMADALKLFCAGGAEEIGRSAIQVLGANGYSEAYPVERLYRDAVLLSIGGGTNEALEKNITRLLTREEGRKSWI
ncbi:MAG: acyl-CoA dehydrogenase family protein [Proteobacteria bacterium]|nr:acyl-CoA dehydrogenase family protein [Pseudomonadota bacterium]